MLDPVAYINEPRWHSMSLGLERIKELLAGLGNPQDKLRFVHVAGTNGKGSTSAMMASILQQAGLRVGLFTSPYIITFEERIRVNGENISLESLRAVTQQVKDVAESMAEHPTEFELMTAVAFLHFAQEGCDIVVAEVGLGGRLDSTNVIRTAEVCVIAPIALDHCSFLGNTIAEIAGEKAGIIKQGVPVVSAEQHVDAQRVIKAVAFEALAPYYSEVKLAALCGTNDCFSYKGFSKLSIALEAPYQRENAALALEAVLALRMRGWEISDCAVRSGLACAMWPGRFERVLESPVFLVDGSHNPQGAASLARSLRECYAGVKPVFLLGVLEDKDHDAVLKELLPLASSVVAVTPPNPRALPAAALAEDVLRFSQGAVPACAAESISQGVEEAINQAGPDGMVCAAGSLYSIGEIMKALRNRH